MSNSAENQLDQSKAEESYTVKRRNPDQGQVDNQMGIPTLHDFGSFKSTTPINQGVQLTRDELLQKLSSENDIPQGYLSPVELKNLQFTRDQHQESLPKYAASYHLTENNEQRDANERYRRGAWCFCRLTEKIEAGEFDDLKYDPDSTVLFDSLDTDWLRDADNNINGTHLDPDELNKIFALIKTYKIPAV